MPYADKFGFPRCLSCV